MNIKQVWCVSYALIVSLLLSSCVTATLNIEKDYSMSPGIGKGVVIASLTRHGYQDLSFFVQIKLRGIGSKYEGKVNVTGDYVSEDDWACPNFSNIPANKPCGRLMVIELPQGDYEYYSWIGGSNNSTIKPKKDFSKKFTVVSGKAVYIGNIHIGIGGRRFSMAVQDKQDRDLELFLIKYQNIKKEDIVVSILK